MQQEGAFCRDGTFWGFVPDRAEDYRAAWEQWVSGLQSVETEHHLFYFLPDSAAAAEISWLPDWQEERYQHVLEILQVAALDHQIATFLYPDNGTKGSITGDSGNGHSNALNYEVHGVYDEELQMVGAHEDAHIIAWHRIGETVHPVMGEGLAVFVDGLWWGETLESIASTHRAEGTLPTLRTLVDDFWSIDTGTTYPMSGHFYGFLLDRYELTTVNRLYVASDLHQAFQQELGLSTDELEAAWLGTID